MAYAKLVVLFCRNAEEARRVDKHWRKVKKYKRVYSFGAEFSAKHFEEVSEDIWTECNNNRNGDKIVLVYGKN